LSLISPAGFESCVDNFILTEVFEDGF